MYLAVASASRLNPGRPDGIDLVHEDDGGRVLPCHHKQLPHHPATLACDCGFDMGIERGYLPMNFWTSSDPETRMNVHSV